MLSIPVVFDDDLRVRAAQISSRLGLLFRLRTGGSATKIIIPGFYYTNIIGGRRFLSSLKVMRGNAEEKMKNHLMTDTVTQVSILDALLARQFDGYLPCEELLKYGDLGIGTFDRMDGEMIIVDGNLYQARGDGKVYRPDPENRTPFATVCVFRADQTWTVSDAINVEALHNMIDEKASNLNVFCAIRVEGSFSYMKTQTLQIQSKPYPPTAEVVRACVQREIRDVSGTIVGFRCPPYVRGINDPGYHLHFLSDDKMQGGHVLDFVMEQGDCAIDICGNHHVILPEDGAALADIDLSRDLVTEFHEALEALSESGNSTRFTKRSPNS